MTENQVVHKANPDEIIVDPRQRRKRKPKDLQELARSINSVGQLHPGVCYLNPEGKPVLIVGETRLKACQFLKIPYSYILREEITDELTLKQMELEENLCREDLHWTDEVAAKKELHELYQTKYGETRPGAAGGHKLSDTATHLGESLSLFAADVELAVWAEEIPEVAEAKNKTMAKKVIDRLKKGVNRRLLLKKALGVPTEPLIPERSVDEKDFEQEYEDDDCEEYEYEVAGRTQPTPSEPKIPTTNQAFLIEYDKRCRLGRMEDLLTETNYYDIVLFDPPWGVNFDTVALDTGGKESYEDSFAAFKTKLLEWLEQVYGSMAEHSHLYLFFGIVHHQFVYDTLEQVGFTTNRMPIFWHKLGAHRTRNPEIWPGRCYEAIAYARKGKKPLFKLGAPDIQPTPPPTPTMKQEHPSAKHPDIYIELLRRSASPGDKVLDPMGGSGMSAVACEYVRPDLELDWTLIEEKETFRDLSLFNLLQGYENIVKIKLTPPKGFKELTPGTPEYLNYWKGHPEEQEAMMAWSKEQEEKETK